MFKFTENDLTSIKKSLLILGILGLISGLIAQKYTGSSILVIVFSSLPVFTLAYLLHIRSKSAWCFGIFVILCCLMSQVTSIWLTPNVETSILYKASSSIIFSVSILYACWLWYKSKDAF